MKLSLKTKQHTQIALGPVFVLLMVFPPTEVAFHFKTQKYFKERYMLLRYVRKAKQENVDDLTGKLPRNYSLY